MDPGALTYRACPLTLGSTLLSNQTSAKLSGGLWSAAIETHCVGPGPTESNAVYCFLYLKLQFCYVSNILAWYLSFYYCDKLLL